MGVSVALSASVFLLERPNARDAVSVVLQYRDISRLMNRLSLSYIVVRKHSHDENEWNNYIKDTIFTRVNPEKKIEIINEQFKDSSTNLHN